MLVQLVGSSSLMHSATGLATDEICRFPYRHLMQPSSDRLYGTTTCTSKREEGLLHHITGQGRIPRGAPCGGVDHAYVCIHQLLKSRRITVMVVAREEVEI